MDVPKRSLILFLCAGLALMGMPAGPAATSGGQPREEVFVSGAGSLPVPRDWRASTRRLPGGPTAILLFSGPSAKRAWERAGLGPGQLLVEVLPPYLDSDPDGQARELESDLRSEGWATSRSFSSHRDRRVVDASGPGVIRTHILGPGYRVRVTAAARTSEFEQTVSGYRDEG